MSALVRSRSPRRSIELAVPLLLASLLVAAVLSNAGVHVAQPAKAATTDSVVVTATVPSGLSIADQCAGAMGISVVLGGHAADDCQIQFGATNDSSVNLRASSSAGTFFNAGFADEGATCAALGTVDEAGLKVSAVGTSVTNSWGCTTTATATNGGYKGVPDAFTNVCLTGALGTTLTCDLAVGTWEQGSDLANGSLTGTLNLDVLG